jgi:hypothetical protein
MRYAAIGLLVALLALTFALPARVQEPRPPEDPLADRVKKAIERGVEYLRGEEEGRGHLEKNTVSAAFPGGWTALGALALLNAGVPPDDPLMERMLRYLRTVEPTKTYVVGLQTMVFALAGQAEDKERIQRNVDWLVAARVMNGDNLAGWTYGKAGPMPDNSNTQYALLGLHEGFVAGAEVKPEVWQSILDFYKATETKDKDGRPRGGWVYRPNSPEPTFTMSTAGLCGLLIASQDLKASKLKEPPDCDRNCGKEGEDEHLKAALDWVGKRMPRNADEVSTVLARHLYYSLYGIERAGRLSGQRFLGEVDWYRVGCEYLVRVQRANGSWAGPTKARCPCSGPVCAPLSLKGRTGPHQQAGPRSRRGLEPAPLRRPQPVRLRSELFKKQPSPGRSSTRRAGDLTRQRIDDLTSDLLQSPVVLLSGSRPPRLSGGERKLLKNYLENGGFLLAEACCGSKAFDTGFRDMLATEGCSRYAAEASTPITRLAPPASCGRSEQARAVGPVAGLQDGGDLQPEGQPRLLVGHELHQQGQAARGV